MILPSAMPGREFVVILLLPMSQPVCSHEQVAKIGRCGSNEARQHPERAFCPECNGLKAYPTYRAEDVAKISTRLCHNSEPNPAQTPVKRAISSTAIVALAVCFLLTTRDSARSLTGGIDVGPDDIGAKASVVLYYRGKPFCGGVVLQDRYVLTAAHCFTDGRGNIVKSAERIEVHYWNREKPKRDARKVEKLAVHENLLHQERVSYPSARPWDFINFPVNHEDIAVLKLKSPHPAGSISAFVPPIDNEYTATSGRGDSTWFYAYGAAVNGSFGKLQRALIGQYRPLERVIPGKPPEAFYVVRQMIIITAAFNKNVSQCHGDSGSGVFLAKSDGVEYDENPDKLPNAIELNQGLPILVGLVSQYPVTKLSQKNEPCGRDIGANAYEATRVDYYHDWILSKVKEMQ